MVSTTANTRTAGQDLLYGRLRLVGAALGMIVGLAVLAGHLAGFMTIDPFGSALPTARPYTAGCLVLLGLGFLLGSVMRGRFSQATARYAILISMVLLFLGLISEVVPAPGSAALAQLAPKGVWPMGFSIGINPACALLLLAFGETLRRRGYLTLSQSFAGAACALLFMALSGYLTGIAGFRGAMAPAVFCGVGALAVSLLFSVPRRGFMKALIARSGPGQLARTLLASSTAFLLLTGWFVSRRIDAPGILLPADGALLIYETAAIIAATWVVIIVSLVRADRLDRARRRAEESLQRAASTDALTGLMTRNKMMGLRKDWDQAARPPAASLFVDLDRFRAVNEAFGPEEGDRVLLEVARRLSDVAGAHPVARMGGDEFAIYGVNLNVREAIRLGYAIVAAMEAPFDVAGRRFRLVASVGIAHTEASQETDLRQAADDAVYVAKQRGGNQAVFFTREMHEKRHSDVELEQDLREALHRDDQIGLVFQPVVALKSKDVCAVEALARWTHPRLGPISPDRFIKLAETTGLMGPLGSKLMALTAQQAAELRAGDATGAVPVVNMNVSATQFQTGDIVNDLYQLVQKSGLAPGHFCLEVTEGVFADEKVVRMLGRARQLGFGVAMDDFGVGYSTLAQLPRLPINTLKLDKGFLLHATESAGDAAVLSAMIQLAHTLQMAVVAEGVETQAQLDLIGTFGCDAAQGYLIARPMRAEALKSWLSRTQPAEAVTLQKGI